MGDVPRAMLLGSYFVAFAIQVLGLSNEQVTLLLSVIPMIVLVRYPFLDLIRETPRIYPTLIARWNTILLLFILLIVPSSWFSLPFLIVIAVVFLIGNEFLQNAVAPGLINEITTRSDRGTFFGKMRTAKMAPAFVFALIGFFYVGDTMDRSEHRVLLLMAIGLATYAAIWMAKIPATPPPDEVRASVGRGQFWAILRSSQLLRRPLWLMLISKVLLWPILTVYIIGTLHLPANLVMFQVLIAMLGGICSVFLWGKKADRTGFRPIFQSFFLFSIVTFPLIFFVPDFAEVQTYGPQWIVGVCALMLSTFIGAVLLAGQDMAASMYYTLYVNGRNGFHALNILTMFGAIAQAILTALGGYLLIVLTRGELQNLAASGESYIWIDPFRVVSFGIITTFCLFGWWLSRGIPDA